MSDPLSIIEGMATLPAELLELSARRHGVLRRAELVDAGVTRRRIDRLIVRRVLERVGRGVYRVCGGAATPAQATLIACLDADGPATHRTACALHGLGSHVLNPVGTRPEVMIHEARNTRSHLARLRTTSTLDPIDLTVVDGVPCTTVARTLLSMASIAGLRIDGKEVSEWHVEDLFDEALAKGLTTLDEMRTMLERLRRSGRGGVLLIERLVEERAAGAITESHLERRALPVLELASSEPPVCQARIAPQGSFVARVDFLYPRAKLIVEVSGYRWHRTQEQMERDAERRRRLTLMGFTVLDFTYREVVRRPGVVVEGVRSFLDAPTSSTRASPAA